MSRSIAIALLSCLTIPSASTSPAGEILILGDSWGVQIGPSVTSVAGSAGFTVDDEKAVGGRTAADMAKADGLEEITSALNDNPDAKVIHLVIGGNDFLRNWDASLNTIDEQALFDSIIADVVTIANHISTVRPDVQTFHMGYDFPRPLPALGTPAQVNQAALTLAALQESIVAPNYNFIEFYGLTQEVYGINGNPPNGTSDSNFPGPEIAFKVDDNIHLTDDAYLLFAQASFNAYQSVLVPEPTSTTTLRLAAIGMIGYRRRR